MVRAMKGKILAALVVIVAVGATTVSNLVLSSVYNTVHREIFVQIDNQVEKVTPQTLEEAEDAGLDVLFIPAENETQSQSISWSDTSWYQSAQVSNIANVSQSNNNQILNSNNSQMNPLQVGAYQYLTGEAYVLTVKRKSSVPENYRRQAGSENTSAPVLLSPQSGETILDNVAELEWESPSSSQGLDQYKLQIDNEPEFSAPYIVDNIVSTTRSSVFLFSDSSPDQVYYWRVGVVENVGVSDNLGVSENALHTSPMSSLESSVTVDNWSDPGYFFVASPSTELGGVFVYETKPMDGLPFAASIGIASSLIIFAVWIGYRRHWGDVASALLEQGLHEMTLRDVEILGYIMNKGEFTIPEIMKLTNASKLTVWRVVQKLEDQGIVKLTQQTKPAASGLGGRGKPSNVYKYVGKNKQPEKPQLLEQKSQSPAAQPQPSEQP